MMMKVLPPLATILALVVAAPARADGGKTIAGRCLAVIDGKTWFAKDKPCDIRLEPGGGFNISYGDDIHVVPDKATGTATATWAHYVGYGGTHTTLGPLHHEGACWRDARATICAWDGVDEAHRARAAPYTSFHALIGKDITGRCQTGNCEFFRFLSAKLVAHNAREALYALKVHQWDVERVDEKPPGKRTDWGTGTMYIRCSRTRPAMISDEKPATMFDFAPAAENGTSGATELVNIQYAAACHATASTLDRTEATLLGYAPDADFSDDETIATPMDGLADRPRLPTSLDIDWSDDADRGIDVSPLLEPPLGEAVKALSVRFGDAKPQEIALATLRFDPIVHLPKGASEASLQLVFEDGSHGHALTWTKETPK